MSSLWRFGGLPPGVFLRRLWREVVDDEIYGRSAELAYYFFFSSIPLLLFLTALFGTVVGMSAALRRELFAYLEAVIPSPDALSLVRDTLAEVIAQRGNKLSVGLLLALWVASQGVAAVGRVLDTAYGIAPRQRRPMWREQVIAVALTVACLLLTVAALVLIFYGGEVAGFLAGRPLPGSGLITTVWSWLRWPLGLLFVLAAFELIYNFSPAPGSHPRRTHWLTPGAVVGVGLWLAASFGLKAYLERFDVASKIYGSLGALMALMLWFYLTGFAILLGGEVNSEILQAMGEVGRRRLSRLE